MIVYTAPKTYGIYAFDKWLKTTNSITETIPYESVTVNALYHNWITAVYKLNVPQLNVPDTVYTEWNQGTIEINVKNSNSVDHTPMEWFSETDESWIAIDDGTGKGVEEGTIRLVIANNNGPDRSGKLMVYALDASNPEKVIYVIQKEQAIGIRALREHGRKMRIYPNPALTEISVELPGESGKAGYISILNPDGRVLCRQDFPAGKTGCLTIPVAELPSGIFLVKAVKGDNFWISTFVKK
jgi:hypothetical protein